LNEYEYNTEFAGRNWNAGEIVEIVLRKKDGSLSVLDSLRTPIELVLMCLMQSLVQLVDLCYVSRSTSFSLSPSSHPSLLPPQLAHIHHMNHAHEFKALDLKLRQEVTFLRLNKYFGDGFWSAGHSLVHESMEDGHRGFDEDGDEHRWLW
jgi:hypothetical protein